MNQEQSPHPRTMSVRHAAAVTACLGAIALVAGSYWMSMIQLPSPERADREDVVRWLVLRDLRHETTETRTALLRRVEEEFGGGFDSGELGQQLDERYRDRLWTNFLVLLETWYSNQVDGYLATGPSERLAFLDETIAQIEGWKGLAALGPNGDGGSPTGDTMLSLFGQQIRLWKEEASPQRRREITEFDTSLRARWLVHALGLGSD